MRTLFLDIETAPNLGYVWGKYEQNVIAYERERYMLCFTYQWEATGKTKAVAQWDFPEAFSADPMDDSLVIAELIKLLHEADLVIGHNLDRFDIKMSNTFMAINGQLPPSPYQTVDTLKVARKYFAFNSNKLGDLLETLGIGEKLNAGGFSTWLGCMSGDKKAQKKMVTYAKRDTAVLPKLYETLRPFMAGHPSMNQGDPDACPYCKADGRHLKKDGLRYTKVSTYQGYWCAACGGYPSDRTAMKTDKPRRVAR